MSYEAGHGTPVYFAQDGTLVVASSGTLLIESGGQITNNGTISGLTKGNVYHVDSVNGNDANDGTTWTKAVATLNVAIGLCTADRGDIILIAPKHVETYTTTGTKVTINIANLTIIGLGSGADRPTFTFGHTGATWVWSAAACTLANVLFVTGVDQVTTYCTISGADATLLDIETRDASTPFEVVDAFITTAAADRLTVRRHVHNGYETSGTPHNVRIWKLVGCDTGLFEDCRWLTKASTAVVNFVTTASSGVTFRRCTFLVTSTTDFSKNVVDTVTGSTWSVEAGCFDMGAGQFFAGGSGLAVHTLEPQKAAGSNFVVEINVTSSTIPNNTQTSGAFTGAASGDVVIEDILLQTDATGVAGPTNVNFTTDNAKGLTGASGVSAVEAVSALGANKTIAVKAEGTTKHLPFVLESAKKLYISGSDGAGTGAGVLRVTLVCRRVTDGASLAAGGIGS